MSGTVTNLVRRYTRWLHTGWPAGKVERLPRVNDDGSTRAPGLYVAGDVTGIPLLKFSAHTGARVVQTIAADPGFRQREKGALFNGKQVLDLVIVGGGVAGMSAALEARKLGFSFQVLEASEPFFTLVNFPRRKPIYTYPTAMEPAGELKFTEKSGVKEGLLEDLYAQTVDRGIEPVAARAEYVRRAGGFLEVVVADGENPVAHRVVVAIGRSGDFRRLSVPGEDLDKVYNRLHDPRDFAGRDVLVVGGGDSALETAIAIAGCGGRVTLSYRQAAFSRPRPENVEQVLALADGCPAAVEVESPSSERVTTPSGAFLGADEAKGSLRLMMSSRVLEIREDTVAVENAEGRAEEFENDFVFPMIGREAPLAFFRRSGVPIRGEWRAGTWAALIGILLAAFFVYHWKTDAGIPIKHWFAEAGWFPFNLGSPDNPATFAGTLQISLGQPAFYYSLAYTLCVVLFGVARIRRRKTPYIAAQTVVLMLIQTLPLFLLPYLLLPWAGHNGWFDPGGALRPVADALFPESQWAEHGREYWRSLGLILAWPLFVWNVFTAEPQWAWLGIGAVQTFVLIPLMLWRWGKGAYCGWICSCGALAETMGDEQRHKMPHGPGWNRLNMLGQGILLLAFVLLALRAAGWMLPADHWVNGAYMGLFMGKGTDWGDLGFPFSFLNYVWSVDLLLAGILGVGLYWHFSGRVWCRFACPLAALMHVYTRFSQFRILADKKKCISCNVCTSVCHQGIDVMSFANKGLPMEDPQCVRCSACVQSCPTGVLWFGRVDRSGKVLGADPLWASPVRMREGGG